MTLIELASLFEEQKSWLVTGSGLSKDALHIYFGLTLFLLVRLLWRWRGGWVIAWLAVVAMACGGEYLDIAAEASRAAIQPDAAHWHDIWNTAFWPTVFMLVGRWLQPAPKAPVLTPAGTDAAPTENSGEDAERGLEQA
ncbi:hypothetical protein [Sphingopyxis macrogoltabida]|uniref:Uncharacterized protein n=1 Tax=Sphingopyxis macrogoltabida TaxID=33050 RepID=A0AAC8YWG4_SPHMC|nr:hypothetical protein [Sphingopyxis macrogoltabida]ALJ11349.1 hypothetical protein LH19_00595 [Sphingopyxis macrogoltabida]AMU87546.1 hypothetical protein ATM17_00595 [Sphingopyxis macrogoltabida]